MMTPDNCSSGPMTVLFSLIVFVGAFLLFQIQPLVAKQLLPFFGGSASVWVVCMIFFQVTLLAGYAYAHALDTRYRFSRQRNIHLALILLSWLTLPVAVDFSMASDLPPTAGVLLVLGATVGMPFFLLSATSTLMQAWLRNTHAHLNPYRLYVLSNAGSLLGLLGYPFLFDYFLGLTSQVWVWTGAYLCFSALLFTLLWSVRHIEASPETVSASRSMPVPAGNRLWWLFFSFSGSFLLLSMTNYLSYEIAPSPFIWVLPLAAYLISFMVGFSDRPLYHRRVYVVLLALAITLNFIGWRFGTQTLNLFSILPAVVLVFLAATVCHAEAYRKRPDPAHLTQFYLMIALGGALGGIAVGIVFPLVFSSLAETNLSLVIALVLALGLAGYIHREYVRRRREYFYSLGTLMATLFFVTFSTVALISSLYRDHSDIIAQNRSFYGVLKVTEKHSDEYGRVRTLVHGNTVHGLETEKGASHFSYYGPLSGLGKALEAMPDTDRRFGVAGLGVGTLARYATPGDVVDFYEIDEQVTQVAREHFTYLESIPASVELSVHHGDARLVLEHTPAQGYDLLVSDAFSGDAIPAHLLTAEMFEIYHKHLADDGMLAINGSNRYLDITPVVVHHARQLGMDHIVVHSEGQENEFPALWILLSTNRELLEKIDPDYREKEYTGRTVEWTDDSWSLLDVLL